MIRLSVSGDGDQALLNGAVGRDELSGGPGADVFVRAGTDETGATIGSTDVICDVNAAKGDRVNLEAIDANVYAAGDR